MKTLLESLLDDEDVIIDKYGREEAIKQWLKEYCLIDGKYTINKDWTVDIDGDLYINPNMNTFSQLPVNIFTFNIVTGLFSLDNCRNLISLKGSPIKAQGFACDNCSKLKNLKGMSQYPVNPNTNNLFISCNFCDSIKTLEGAPKKCREFFCHHCKNLESLKGSPKECEEFNCCDCIKLETLKGAPEKCEEFSCVGCSKIKSLEGAPKNCNYFNCSNCGRKFTYEEIKQYI